MVVKMYRCLMCNNLENGIIYFNNILGFLQMEKLKHTYQTLHFPKFTELPKHKDKKNG